MGTYHYHAIYNDKGMTTLTEIRFRLASCGVQSSLISWVITWALHFATDLLIFILPFFFLRHLRVDWKKRLGLYTTFGVAILSIGTCLARLLVITSAYPEVPITNVQLLCALDSYAGLIVACLLSLRPYLTHNHASSYQRSLRDDSYMHNSADFNGAIPDSPTSPKPVG